MKQRGSSRSPKRRRLSKNYEPPFDDDMELRVRVLTVIRDYPGSGVWYLPSHLGVPEKDVQRIVKQLCSPYKGDGPIVRESEGRLFAIGREE